MNLKNTLYLAIGFASTSLIACNSSGGAQSPETMGSVVSTSNYQPKKVAQTPTKLGNLMNQATPTSGNFKASSAGYNPAHGQPGHNCDLAVGAPLGGASTAAGPQAALATLPTQSSSPNFNASAGTNLNPAHGQPGHDCALAVGAPLPSKAGVGTPIPAMPATAPNFTTSNNTKLNPAHGQPGHDCAVAVGDPLPSAGLSKAAAAPVPAGLSTLTESVPTSIAAPSLTAPAAGTPNFKVNTTGSAFGAKLNPAHGQPGHDCGVAVGAPLPG